MMRNLTPGAQIDELRAVLQISEQRRQKAEARLADRERQLGYATAIIADLDQHIAELQTESRALRDDDGQLALISECGVPNEMWA